jgi:hypothetical protein
VRQYVEEERAHRSLDHRRINCLIDPVNSDKMRFTLPSRIPLAQTFVFAAVFFCVQQIEHTGIFFSILYFAFLIMTVIAFNFAEGFTRAIGAYIFWYSTLIVIVGVTWKAVVGEPADSNLYTPLLDISLYTASMAMLLIVTILNRKMDVRSLGVGGGLSGTNLNYTAAGTGCLIVWMMIIYADMLFGQAPGSIVSALVQMNVFGPLGLILTTIGAIQDSGGRRSLSPISIAGLAYFSFIGLTSFSKQVMLAPMLCWVLGVFYSRMRVRLIHVVALVLMAVVSFGFVSPLSASRDLSEGLDTTARVALIFHLVTHWDEFQAHVKSQQDMLAENGLVRYYNEPQGSLIERLSMIPPDDSLFYYSSQGHFEGIEPVQEYFTNLLPHFLAPNKHLTFSGNYYAHEMGLGIAEDDVTTGISFSPVGEAYHCEGWGGVFWLLPLIWILLFTSVDFIVGDMSKYPWGLMVIVYFSHAAPETLLGGMIYFIGYGNFGMFFAIVIVTRIAPILGALLTGKVPSTSTRSVNRRIPVLTQYQT